MKINRIIFTFIRISFAALLLIAVLYGTVRVSMTAYDFGYHVFTEDAIDEAPGHDVLVSITDDMSSLEIGELLQERGLIRDANLFVLQLRLSVYSGKLKTGTYTLNTSQTPKEMMAVMAGSDEEETTETES